MIYTVLLTDGTCRTVHAKTRPTDIGITEWLAVVLCVSQFDIDRIDAAEPLPIKR